jgi:hypothetical protein
MRSKKCNPEVRIVVFTDAKKEFFVILSSQLTSLTSQ